MIRIIVQKKSFKMSFWKRLKCIKNAFDVSWLDAYFFVRKINQGHGVVITSNPVDNEQLLMLDKLQGNLHQYFFTTNKVISALNSIIPINKFTYLFCRYKNKADIHGITFKVYISDNPGFIDNELNVYDI